MVSGARALPKQFVNEVEGGSRADDLDAFSHEDFFYRILVLSYKVYLMVAGSFDHPFFPQSRTAVHFQGSLDLSNDSFENGESEPQHRRGGSFGSGS